MVRKTYVAEREIEAEIGHIERLISSNAALMQQWKGSLTRLNTELKEIGDISNWLHTLEEATSEIVQITRTLHHAS